MAQHLERLGQALGNHLRAILEKGIDRRSLDGFLAFAHEIEEALGSGHAGQGWKVFASELWRGKGQRVALAQHLPDMAGVAVPFALRLNDQCMGHTGSHGQSVLQAGEKLLHAGVVPTLGGQSLPCLLG